jgi:hypothetical protein
MGLHTPVSERSLQAAALLSIGLALMIVGFLASNCAARRGTVVPVAGAIAPGNGEQMRGACQTVRQAPVTPGLDESCADDLVSMADSVQGLAVFPGFEMPASCP